MCEAVLHISINFTHSYEANESYKTRLQLKPDRFPVASSANTGIMKGALPLGKVSLEFECFM